MTPFRAEWLEHRRRRFTRPDASRYFRPDYARYFRPGHVRPDGPQPCEAKYSPDQPRVPAGNPDGGQWTSEGGGITDSRVLSDASPDPIKPGAQYAAIGHHHVPRGVFEKEKYSFSPETLKIFENEATGPLNDLTSNRYDNLHREYNEAVEEALDRYLGRNKIRSDQMTPDQARTFVQEVKTSRDLRIRRFIRRMINRELLFWYRRGPRGRE